MSFVVSVEHFRALFPRNPDPDGWTLALNAVLPKYGINTGLRVAGFLAQCGHESEGFTALVENLNYSAEALTRTWPNRFPQAVAKLYARKPEKIGNRAYANRMGNGPEESGDGWKHRGRGVIQITGKDMYRQFAAAAGKGYGDVFAYLETKAGAVESAAWFWLRVKNLNPVADAADIVRMTKLINGGTNGLDDRIARYAKARSLFQV